ESGARSSWRTASASSGPSPGSVASPDSSCWARWGRSSSPPCACVSSGTPARPRRPRRWTIRPRDRALERGGSMSGVRRSVVRGSGPLLPAPRRAWSQGTLEGEHALRIEVPILAEDSAAVPLQVSVEHPMEPDHFIRSIEVSLDKDPVPWKGKFLFTPGNGRAWAAFTMRSGSGGLVRAVAECSRHGKFTATREVRVAEGGCATTAPVDRARMGNPQLRLPGSLPPGQVVEVKTKVDHDSQTGLALKGGKYVREAPEFFVKEMLVYLDTEKISEF